jgi:outer membrane lipoprotein SlyB
LGWIAGIRSIVIPGVDPLIAAGPVAAAMGSATVGGIAGGLIDFDVPHVEASRYESRIKDGQILIAVHSENPEMSDRAREIFTANEAEAICTMIDVFTPKIPLRSASGTPRESVA